MVTLGHETCTWVISSIHEIIIWQNLKSCNHTAKWHMANCIFYGCNKRCIQDFLYYSTKTVLHLYVNIKLFNSDYSLLVITCKLFTSQIWCAVRDTKQKLSHKILICCICFCNSLYSRHMSAKGPPPPKVIDKSKKISRQRQQSWAEPIPGCSNMSRACLDTSGCL